VSPAQATPPEVTDAASPPDPSSKPAQSHNAGYRALGLSFVYVPFAVEHDLPGALVGMRALGIRGFGISMPHKLAIMPHLDEVTAAARRIGAVNTVVNDAGRLTGHNTDAVGAVRALREEIEVAGSRCLVVGAGGAGRAIAHGLAEAGATVTLCNRDRAKAESLAEAVQGRSVSFESLPSPLRDDFDIVINATSLGMSIPGFEGLPIPEDALGEGLVVMDIVYKPIETSLVRAAKRRGATAIHGGRMLLHQAARQFELYTGQEAPLTAMDQALMAEIG